MGPNLIALAVPFFFLGIGVEVLVAKRRGVEVYRLGDALGDLGCGIGQQLTSVLLATAVLSGTYSALYEHRLLSLPEGWVQWVVAFVTVEFAYYWWHRLSHEVNLLWAAHVVHHHSEDYNLAVALRQSVTTWLTTLPFYLPIALLGVPLGIFGAVLGISTLYQFWIHTELVPPLGWFEKFFNTPALHRVHHAINPRYLDKNHGAIVSVWDRLFGTYEPETEKCIYGTTRPINSYNPLWAQVETYVDLVKLARRAPTVFDAVKVFFASPAWRPEWMGEYTRRDPAKKYDPVAAPGVRRYVLAQEVVMLVSVFCFLMWGASLDVRSTAAVVFVLVLSLLTLPALIEGKTWAKLAEGARVMTIPLVGLVVFIYR